MAAGSSSPNLKAALPIPRDVDFETVRRTAGKTFGFEIPADLLIELKREFAGCESPESRLNFYRRCFPWRKPCTDDFNCSLKQAETSSQHLEAAHEKYIKKQHLTALQDCNRAVAFAPLDHEALGLAYADRSEVLMALNELEEAIVDIDRALISQYPPEHHAKLLQRRSRCKTMIEEQRESELAMLNHSQDACIERLRKSDQLQAKTYYKKTLFPTTSPRSSELKTFVSQLVHLKELDGQICLVMRADAPAGTVLLIDKPYIAVLNEHLDSKGGNCDYCLKKTHGGIPCNNCVISLYCDENCRDKAQEEFHGELECFCMNYIHRVKADGELKPKVLLVLRLISKLGPQNLYQLFQDCTEKSSGSSAAPKSTSLTYYLKIYNMLKPSKSIRPSTQLGHWMQARILASILDQRTSFFEAAEVANDPEKKNKFKDFLTALIIKHLQSPQIALPLREVSKENKLLGLRPRVNDLEKDMMTALKKLIGYVDYASGLYPVASNLGNSCEPNVVVQPAAKGGAVAVIAARMLKNGEVLRVNFGWHFLYLSLQERQRVLKELLYIECNCLACREDWPELTVLIDGKPKLCCPRCSSHFSYPQKGTRGFDDCVISQPHFRCPKCRTSYSGAKFSTQMEMINKKSLLSISHITGERPFAVMSEALKAMNFHHQNQICPPYFRAMWHQEMFRGALAHVVSLHVKL